jgi:hypothetical protein
MSGIHVPLSCKLEPQRLPLSPLPMFSGFSPGDASRFCTGSGRFPPVTYYLLFFPYFQQQKSGNRKSGRKGSSQNGRFPVRQIPPFFPFEKKRHARPGYDNGIDYISSFAASQTPFSLFISEQSGDRASPDRRRRKPEFSGSEKTAAKDPGRQIFFGKISAADFFRQKSENIA